MYQQIWLDVCSDSSGMFYIHLISQRVHHRVHIWHHRYFQSTIMILPALSCMLRASCLLTIWKYYWGSLKDEYALSGYISLGFNLILTDSVTGVKINLIDNNINKSAFIAFNCSKISNPSFYELGDILLKKFEVIRDMGVLLGSAVLLPFNLTLNKCATGFVSKMREWENLCIVVELYFVRFNWSITIYIALSNNVIGL